MNLWTDKTVRQNTASTVVFREGQFGIQLRDGGFSYQCGFLYEFWYPTIPCPLGATGFVSTGAESGTWGSPDLGSYFDVVGITAAAVIEPFNAERISLIAAPYSTLSRPQTPFEDASYSMFYDIGVKSTDVRDYRICNYAFKFDYGLVDELTGAVVPANSEETRMDQQIVPGIYQFSFPKLNNPIVPVGLAPRYFLIPEGYRILRNQKIGVKFDYPNFFDADGFALMNSADLKNPVRWQGITAKNAYAGFDKLYFSVKKFADAPVGPIGPNGYPTHVIDPRTDPDYESSGLALFPAFDSPTTPTRILLQNPFVNSYLLPPTIPTLAAGNRGLLELELVRSATSNGIIYDVSTRRYQCPVYFGDHYEVYRQRTFKSGALLTAPTDDFDLDGFSNATEWILGSSPTKRSAIPIAPVPKSYTSGGTTASYFGISQKLNVQAVPAVSYTIVRSIDGGLTYAPMVTDANWTVVNNVASNNTTGIKEVSIKSKIISGGKPVIPPGTQTHKYRIDITVL